MNAFFLVTHSQSFNKRYHRHSKSKAMKNYIQLLISTLTFFVLIMPNKGVAQATTEMRLNQQTSSLEWDIIDGAFDESTSAHYQDLGCIVHPVAVTLVHFEGRELQTGIELNWEVLNEVGNEWYTVEQSNGFSPWKKVESIRNDYNQSRYSIIHALPDYGINHYRLSQIDLDGVPKYLSLTSLFYRSGSDMQISAYGSKVLIQSYQPMEIHEISVYDLRGHQLSEQLYYFGDGDQAQIDLSHLPYGIYIIKVEFPDGMLSKKIVLTDEEKESMIF